MNPLLAVSTLGLLANNDPNPLKFSPDLAAVTLVVFLVLLVVLHRYAWVPIMQALDLREQNVAQRLEQAQRDAERAEALLRQYEEQMASAADEASAMQAEARREANRVRESMLAEATAEAKGQRDQAVAEIQQATQRAQQELARLASQSAAAIASQLLDRDLAGHPGAAG